MPPVSVTLAIASFEGIHSSEDRNVINTLIVPAAQTQTTVHARVDSVEVNLWNVISLKIARKWTNARKRNATVRVTFVPGNVILLLTVRTTTVTKPWDGPVDAKPVFVSS